MARTRAYFTVTILILISTFALILSSAGMPDSTKRIQNFGNITQRTEIIVDSYSEENYGDTGVIETFHPSTTWSFDSAESQSFMGVPSKIIGAAFYLRSIGAPSGQLHAVLCSHSGEFGVDSRPNTELARSEPVECSMLTSRYSLVVFSFSGIQQVTLATNTPYCIVLEGPTSGVLDVANNIQVGLDSTKPSHAGNYARYRYGAWRNEGAISLSSFDMIFYVYGDYVTTATVHGRVMHSDGTTPFSGANVELVGYSVNATTGLDGAYSLGSVPSRSYTLRAEALGYEAVERTVDAAAGGDFPLSDILLAAAPRFSVRGYVKYVDNGPASGATVHLIGVSTYMNTTTADGSYEFASVIEGNYELVVDLAGHRQLGVRGMNVTGDTVRNATLAPRKPQGTKIQVPNDGKCYLAAFCSWGTSAPLPEQEAQDVDRFVSIVGKSLYGVENGGTICVGEDFWPMRSPNSWKPLLDDGWFDAFIFSIFPYLRDYPSDADTSNGPTATEWKIANGAYDAWISTLAQQTKDFGYPVFLRIGAEMNGNEGSSQPGGSWIADFGATPTAFIAAWRRVVDIFNATGVTNVDWCISYNFESVGIYDFEDYYPGNNYVDWIGVDYYQISATDDPSSQVAAFYSWAVAKNKPLAVTEWGTNWYNKNIPDADRARYIYDFFDDIELKSEFKMIIYHWNSWWRFQNDNPADYGYMPLASAAYKERIANERYLDYAP